MIGTGKLFKKIENQIEKSGLKNYIELTGAMSPSCVREEFNKAKVAVITSDKQEGWGVVVNEAMNGGCATVACRDIGSVQYLIKDQQNGLIFNSRDKKHMFKCVENLLNDDKLTKQIGEKAYDTINSVWNYKIAAKRLIEFVKNQTVVYSEGPISRG